MASLDNFHTGNPAPYAGHPVGTGLYRYHLPERYALIQQGIHTASNDGGGIRNRVPIAPIQPVVDPLLQTGRAAPDPTYVERVSTGLNDHYVSVRPRTHLRESGDTAEHKLLIQGTACWASRLRNFWAGGGGRRSLATLNTYSRYHPYLGR